MVDPHATRQERLVAECEARARETLRAFNAPASPLRGTDWMEASARAWDVIALAAELVAVTERERAAAEALAEARALAVEVMDKEIGVLSDRARLIVGRANAALGDIPSADDVAGILAAHGDTPEPAADDTAEEANA